MLGAIIGAAVSAAGSIGNAIATKKANDKQKKELKARMRAAESDAVADRYGDWRYSGANLYFNKAAEEMKDYVAQQRAARNVTGAVDNGTAVQAAGKTIGNASAQANAQRQAVGLQMYQQDKSRADGYADKIDDLNAKQSEAATQAWTQLGQTAGNLATSLDGIGGKEKKGVKGSEASAAGANDTAGAGSTGIIDFNRAQTDTDYQQNVKKQIMGGL